MGVHSIVILLWNSFKNRTRQGSINLSYMHSSNALQTFTVEWDTVYPAGDNCRANRSEIKSPWAWLSNPIVPSTLTCPTVRTALVFGSEWFWESEFTNNTCWVLPKAKQKTVSVTIMSPHSMTNFNHTPKLRTLCSWKSTNRSEEEVNLTIQVPCSLELTFQRKHTGTSNTSSTRQ